MAVDNLSNSEPTISGAKNADGILDLLNDESDLPEDNKDSEESDDKSKKSTKSSNDDESDDKDESDKEDESDEDEIKLEDELDDKSEEESLEEIVVPVRKKEILAKYPKLFKDFPALESAYYKAQQYSEILPTLDDAKEAVTKADTLDKFEKDLLSGNLETLFNTVKNAEPKAFRKIADNLIETISKVDESIGLHVVSNVIKQVLSRSEAAGKRTKNADLEAASKIINEYLFQTDEISAPTKLVNEKEDTTESDKLNAERQQFETERFNSALSGLQTRVDNTIKSTIDANIDPKDSMSSYVKRNAIRDAFEQLETTISKDASFKRTLDSMWRAAKEAKYSSSSLDKIRSAYLSKAKTLLPSVIRSARNEALKGIGKQDNNPDKNRKGPLPANRNSESSKSIGNKPKEIPKGMTTKDWLMAD